VTLQMGLPDEDEIEIEHLLDVWLSNGMGLPMGWKGLTDKVTHPLFFILYYGTSF
jgi:hypothetical protein